MITNYHFNPYGFKWDLLANKGEKNKINKK